jgi:hypothetical protein
MLKSLPGRILWAAVLAMLVAMAAPVMASPGAEVPGHIAAAPGADGVGLGQWQPHHHHDPTQAAHAHCMGCLGFPLPPGPVGLFSVGSGGFTLASRTVRNGLPPHPDPDPPRTVSRRI